MSEVLVLIDEGSGAFFQDWRYSTDKRVPSFFWAKHLSCARAFPLNDLLLIEGFQKLLRIYGYDTIIYQVQSGRLIRRPVSAERSFSGFRHILNLGASMRAILAATFETLRKLRWHEEIT